MKKRLTAIILCFCLIACTFPTVLAQSKDTSVIKDEDVYAEVIITDSIKTVNISNVRYMPTDNSYELTKKVGKQGVVLNPSKGCEYMNFNFNNTLFPKTPDGGSYTVKVDYFDEGTGFFSLRYDGINNSFNGVHTYHQDIVRMENTHKWRSHTFYIEDADFGGEWQWTDLGIALFSEIARAKSSDKIVIGGMRIEKAFPQQPVQIELISDEIGNIFAPDDAKVLKWQMKNKTNVPVDIKIEYTVFDEYANEYQGGMVNENIDASNSLTREFEAPVSASRPFGVYKIKMKAECSYIYKGESGTRVVSGIYDYSVADKFKDGETRNERLGTATHMITQYHEAEENSELIKEAGFGDIREEIRWATLEKKKGEYDFSGVNSEFMTYFEKNGQKLVFTPLLGNQYYSDSYTADELAIDNTRAKGIPQSAAEKEGYMNYIFAVLEKFDGKVDKVEIWNEPNHQTFNPLNRSPEVYTELVKYCYPRIKERYPHIKVGALSTAAIPLEWIEKAFAAGILDYCDAVTIHPYQWTGVFSHEQFHNDLKGLHALMEKYGGGDKEVWATEWGFSSGKVNWALKTAENQAKCMVQFYTLGCAYDYIDYFQQYNFQSKNVGAEDGEHNFGIVAYHLPQYSAEVGDIHEAPTFDHNTTPYSAKKAYVAITWMNRMMAGAVNDKIFDSPEGIDALGFNRPEGDKAIIMWSNKQQREFVTFAVDNDALLYDMYGNVIMNLKGGMKYTITLDSVPVWIKGNLSNITFSEPEITASIKELTIAVGDSFEVDITDSKNRDLKTNVICHDSFSVNEKGNGKFVFKASNDAQLMNYEIRLEIYDGDRLVAVNRFNINVIDAIEVSLRGKRNESSVDRHTLVATITNKSTQNSYSGKCKIVSPEEFAAKGNTGKFSSLKPGESITIPLNIPRVVQKKYYDISVAVELTNGKVFTGESYIKFESRASRKLNPNIIPIYSTEKFGTPVIDGVATEEEWGESTVVVDKADSYVASTKDEWISSDNISFKANLLWDEENLYFHLTSMDDVHYQEFAETDMWKGDSVQIGIIDNEPDSLKSTAFNEIGIGFYGDEVKVYRSSEHPEQPIGVITDLTAKATKNPNGVTYEVAIPWSTLMRTGYVPREEDSVSFNVILNDNDGTGRKGWMELTPGIGAKKDATQFKCMDFTK